MKNYLIVLIILTIFISCGSEYDNIKQEIEELEQQAQALKKEDDPQSAQRLSDLLADLAVEKEDFANAKAKWENEKSAVDKLSKMREEIDALNSKIEIAKREGDLAKAAELTYGELPRLKASLEEAEKAAE